MTNCKSDMSNVVETVDHIIRNEIYYCVSHLISELSSKEEYHDELLPLMGRESWREALEESDVVIVERHDRVAGDREYCLGSKANSVRYTARYNLPGCMPDSVTYFDNIDDAWEYLADTFNHSWEACPDEGGHEAFTEFDEQLRCSADLDALTGPDGMVYVVDDVYAVYIAKGLDDQEFSDLFPDAIELDDENACREACEACGINDPQQWEVFEHWIVSGWLAEKLERQGEIVGEFMGLTIWGRCTTGQSISLDSVIKAIARELLEVN